MYRFRANGKVLISGEYLVLIGASALAVPLQSGQTLECSVGTKPGILHWSAFDLSGLWFEGHFNISDFSFENCTDRDVAQRLQLLLTEVRALNPDFLRDELSLRVNTRLEFDRHWGFGSSSTLISLVSQWAGIDAMQLHRKVSGGSGYDVACANASSPLLFQIQKGEIRIRPVRFATAFSQHLYLVYLGQKQNSEIEVAAFKGRIHNFTSQVEQISGISDQMASAERVEVIIELMNQHESIMEAVLEKTAVKKRLFSDFQGAVKSLGAWGGDFVLVASVQNETYVRNYFTEKGLDVIFSYNQIALLT
ncbi:MAG: GYDIA family GHMP kinase [Lentimicrobium sp.]|nr:GYDIA family GHMP kinase [Lentimicrobium sp.]